MTCFFSKRVRKLVLYFNLLVTLHFQGGEYQTNTIYMKMVSLMRKSMNLVRLITIQNVGCMFGFSFEVPLNLITVNSS